MFFIVALPIHNIYLGTNHSCNHSYTLFLSTPHNSNEFSDFVKSHKMKAALLLITAEGGPPTKSGISVLESMCAG